MIIKDHQHGQRIWPLEEIKVEQARGATFSVTDGQCRRYADGPIQDEVSFTVGGALGCHTIQTYDSSGEMVEMLQFLVDAETEVRDQGSEYQELLKMLYLTMANHPEDRTIRFQGRLYYVFVPWLRDHVHVLKGMKYFAPRLKDGIDLYRDSQREDGMIWDNCHLRSPAFAGPNHWSVRFDYGGFFRLFDDCSAEFTRIPVENDVEYLFLEGLYYTWKATGDDAWMAASLPAAKKALDYSVTSPYRWSEKFQLLKRGHTIDTWDFQNNEDCLADIVGWPDPMAILPGKTRFGIMFGDNTGYAAGCSYLAEMLEHLGCAEEAAHYRQRGAQIMERLNKVSWNGQFFTHHVAEDPSYQRDLGVDETRQVSLSNAYSLNRPISHDQCKAILETYLGLKDNLPPGSPGEWYTIYPPYQKGYGGHNDIWQYMNASVTPIVAGELARGAFQHGYEAYGVDILQRLSALGQQHGGVFHCSYTGAFPPPPERILTPIDLHSYARSHLPTGLSEASSANPIPSETAPLAGIPFPLLEASLAVGVGGAADLARETRIPIHATAASLYFLHTINRLEHGSLVGKISLLYADGTHASQYVLNDKEVLPWSHWEYLEPGPNARAVWRHNDRENLNMQLTVYGLDNPYPEREIESVQLTAAEGNIEWYLLGLTMSDQPVYFRPGPISYGIPDSWGAAAVVYALVEGLAGVVDSGVAFDRASLSPRWAAAGVDQARVCIRYPASTGYVSYLYTHQLAEKTISLQLTGSGEDCDCRVLLPEGAHGLSNVRVNEEAVSASLDQVEQSLYACIHLPLHPACRVDINYE